MVPSASAQTSASLTVCYTGNDGGRTSALNFSINLTSSDTGTFLQQVVPLTPSQCQVFPLSLMPKNAFTFYTITTDIPPSFNDFTNYSFEIKLSSNLVFDGGAPNGTTDFKSSLNPGGGINSDVEFFKIAGKNCKVPLSPNVTISTSTPQIPGYLNQTDTRWGGDFLGKSRDTLHDGGCLVTAVAMAINTADPNHHKTLTPPLATLPGIAGLLVTPRSLNTFLTSGFPIPYAPPLTPPQPSNPKKGGAIHSVDTVARMVSNSGLRLSALPGGAIDSRRDLNTAQSDLADAVCQSQLPVLLGVNLTGLKANHFVLVTGVSTANDGTQSFTIADPGHQATNSLGAYHNEYIIQGIIKDPITNVSGLNVSTDNLSDLSIIDPNGNRTGIDPGTRELLQEIGNSAYFANGIDDPDTGDIISDDDTHTVQLFQPSPGTFSIVVTGLGTGLSNITISPFSTNGTPQQGIVTNQSVSSGSIQTYQLKYDPSGTDLPKLELLSGDRNGDGIVNCADLAIVNASFGKKSGQNGFDPRADVNGDGVVNIFDLSAVAKQIPAGMICH
jgi:hypothetical protein